MLFVPRETSGDKAAELALERLGLLVVFVAVIVVLGFRGEALAAVLALAEVFIPHVRASDVDLKEKLRLWLYIFNQLQSISFEHWKTLPISLNNHFPGLNHISSFFFIKLRGIHK